MDGGGIIKNSSPKKIKHTLLYLLSSSWLYHITKLCWVVWVPFFLFKAYSNWRMFCSFKDRKTWIRCQVSKAVWSQRLWLRTSSVVRRFHTAEWWKLTASRLGTSRNSSGKKAATGIAPFKAGNANMEFWCWITCFWHCLCWLLKVCNMYCMLFTKARVKIRTQSKGVVHRKKEQGNFNCSSLVTSGIDFILRHI